jgi:hypothetical protein
LLNFLLPLSSLHLFARGAGSMKGSNVSFLCVSPEQQEQDIVAVRERGVHSGVLVPKHAIRDALPDFTTLSWDVRCFKYNILEDNSNANLVGF